MQSQHFFASIVMFLFCGHIQDSEETEIRRLIEQLGETSPAVRSKAVELLLNYWQFEGIENILDVAINDAKEFNNSHKISALKEILNQIRIKRDPTKEAIRLLSNVLGKEIETITPDRALSYLSEWILNPIVFFNNFSIDHVEVRTAAIAWFIKKLTTPISKQHLLSRLINVVQENKEYAIHIKDCHSAIEHFVDDMDTQVQVNAIDLFGRIGLYACVGRIASHLHNKNQNIKIASVLALGRLGAKEYSNDIASIMSNCVAARIYAVRALALLGAEEYSNNIAEFLDGNGSTSLLIEALYSLALLRAKKHAAKISIFLDYDNPGIRSLVIEILTEFNSVEHAEKIASLMMYDDDYSVRVQAIRALGILGANKYADSIAAYLRTELENEKMISVMSEVKATAALALGNLRNKNYTEDICKLLSHNWLEVRSSAVLALILISPEEYKSKSKTFEDEETICWVKKNGDALYFNLDFTNLDDGNRVIFDEEGPQYQRIRKDWMRITVKDAIDTILRK
ncbi:MAG: HEAT repeat domain-containing protein [Planctomycetes bacterium]|nr:HEAT repeat domain-containing protein [Planctomycetota bacterium]